MKTTQGGFPALFLTPRMQWMLVFCAALGPLLWIVHRMILGDLGTDPAQTLIDTLGSSAMWLLLLTLTLTPAREWLGWREAPRLRRMCGLWAAFYATLHVLAYTFLLADWQAFAEDLVKRPYIGVGFMAFLILLLLAATSPKVMLRKLKKRWKPLHRSVYLAAILVVVHFWWQSRGDFGEPLLLACLFATVLILRLPRLKKWRPEIPRPSL